MSRHFNRRDFLKTGGIAVAGSLILPPMFSGCILEPRAASPLSFQLDDYLNHFGVTRQMIMEVMAEGLSKGGDYCDLFFEHSISNSISLEDNSVNRAFSNVDFGVGIRVLSGDQTGYSYTEDITPQAMKSAARTAANIATGSSKVRVADLTQKTIPQYYHIKTPWEEVSINNKIPLLQQLNNRTFELDSRISKTNVNFSDDTSYILFANSDGVISCDYRPMGQISASCVAEQNGRKEQNGYSVSARNDVAMFSESELNRIANEAVTSTVLLFDAETPKGGQMPVVMGAGSSGILLHEAIGHGMEADFNRREESIFSDKIGKKVAEDFVSIVDDGTVSNMRGSINVDDEGNDTQNTFMVRDGIMTSYLHDKISARHYGVAPTGNGRRQSFRHMPLPRMRNTYMLNGPHTKEEIIESVDYGVYAESFTNGQVMIGAGDFTFYVKQGYLIEKGKLTQPIKDINIIGNGPKVLADITMVANDLTMSEAGWSCGKGGQSVPASLGQPTIKVKQITVGGKSA
ncbi:MAG: metallopeptidase TldD-related protein [Bacteroidales bacterium]